MIETTTKVIIKPDTPAGKKLKKIDTDDEISDITSDIERTKTRCKEEIRLLEEKRKQLKSKGGLNSKKKLTMHT